MDTFDLAADWRRSFHRQGLRDFDALWGLPHDWVETPNQRRGGWSGVSRLRLEDAQGRPRTLFVKRQQHQARRSAQTGWRARPTYFHEYLFLKRFQALGAPVVDWLCYAERDQEALLVTLAPAGYIDLPALAGQLDAPRFAEAMAAVVEALGTLHRHRWQHGSCYPAHILVHPATLSVRLLDLERCRRHRTGAAAAREDLRQLTRRCDFLTPELMARMAQAVRRHLPSFDPALLALS
ncbi:InaA protein [Alcanivorax sp. N3-2A]|nr:InaA protein [Alcanivorax sp. N3-2A]